VKRAYTGANIASRSLGVAIVISATYLILVKVGVMR